MAFKHSMFVLIMIAGLLFATGRASAQADQTIYGENLVNGWADWSWSARDLASSDFAHSGTKSVKVTYAAGYQGFYLHHDAFSTTPYTTLSFWITGGGVGGRKINVQALINDSAQAAVALDSYIAGGGIAANEWREVRIPIAALQAAQKTSMTGFWLQDSSGGSQPPFYLDDIKLIATPAPAITQISIDASNVRRTVDERLFGINAAVWDSAFMSQATTGILTAMKTRALRFPGGSLSDEYDWQSNTTSGNTWTWATGFDSFAGIARAINARVFVTANYGTGTPEQAAAWVQYSNVNQRYGFEYWEIGNENYGTWETDKHSRPHDPFTYATLARDFITQMKAADPSIKVGVVVSTGEDSYANYNDHPATNPRTLKTHNGWTPVLLATLRSLGVMPDFVAYHKYAQNPSLESDSGLLQSAASWESDATDLRTQLNDYLGPQAAGVEIVCTENNSVSSMPGKQTTSLVNGLFLAESTGQILQTEFNALVWWDLRNGKEIANNNASDLYGWRGYGDYGVVSPQSDFYPAYYIGRLLTHFARGGEIVVPSSSNYSGLAIYAVRRENQELNLLLINKTPDSSLNAEITLNGFVPQSNAAVYAYGISQDDAARTGTASTDISESSFATAASKFNYSVGPYSAVVISLAAAPSCNGSLAAARKRFGFIGGRGSVGIDAPPTCSWSATTNASWLMLGTANGNGGGAVSFSVAANTGKARQATISAGAQSITIEQDGAQSRTKR
jgi:alpha-N-arabinofuranosidase